MKRCNHPRLELSKNGVHCPDCGLEISAHDLRLKRNVLRIIKPFRKVHGDAAGDMLDALYRIRDFAR